MDLGNILTFLSKQSDNFCDHRMLPGASPGDWIILVCFGMHEFANFDKANVGMNVLMNA